MKRLLALLLAVLMLAGCAVTQPPATTENTTEDTTSSTDSQPQESMGPGIYDPGSAVEQQTGGAVRVYPLEGTCDGVLLMGDQVLLYFPGDHTQLNTYSGDALHLQTTVSRYPQISEDGEDIQITDQGMSYYNKGTKTLVILDQQLQERYKVSLPEDARGIPVVDQAMTTAYFCTSEGIRALNLETGIAHMLRQMENATGTLIQSCFDGEILVCTTTETDGTVTTEFIQSANGLKVGQDTALLSVDTYGALYFLQRAPEGNVIYQFGIGNEALQQFKPGNPDTRVICVLELGGVLTVSTTETASVLDLYDLESGLRTSSVSLEGAAGLRDFVVDPRGYIWFLDENSALYRWEVSKSKTDDETVYTSTWYTGSNPNTDGLALCQAEADRIGQQHGVTIRLWQDALAAPWTELTEEYRVEAYEKALPLLEATLAMFPEGFLTEFGDICDSGRVTISLVADAGSGGAQQEWLDGNAHIAVEMGEDMQAQLLRMLYRVMDTYILSENSILDQWDADKPAEDRANVFVEALREGNGEFFEKSSVQKKLKTLCRAIRDAFGMKKYKSELPWEQYLSKPLY